MPSLIYILTLFFLAADAIGSSDKISKYLFFSSREIVTVVIIGFVIWRLIKHKILDKRLTQLNLITSTISIAASAALVITNYAFTTNAVFAATHIQNPQLLLIGVYTGIVNLLILSDSWYTKHYQQLIYFGAPALATLALIVRLFPFDIFVVLSQEDHLVENMQVVVLIIACAISIYIARTFFTRRRILLGILFALFALTLFVFAGEEISWGQRIFHLATPSYFAKTNVQDEINIHNLSVMGNSVNLGYILLGLYGMVTWMIQKKIPRLQKDPYIYFIPPWYTLGYYFIGFLYNFYTRLGNHHVGEWSEFVELMLYTAVMCTMIAWSQLLSKPVRTG